MDTAQDGYGRSMVGGPKSGAAIVRIRGGCFPAGLFLDEDVLAFDAYGIDLHAGVGNLH